MRRAVRGGGLAVGIDLGTTFSAVAKVNEFGKPELIPNREGEEAHSVGGVLRRRVAGRWNDGEAFGAGVAAGCGGVRQAFDGRSVVAVRDRGWHEYRPEEISALILKRLKVDAERVLGAEVTDAVITVPAIFDDAPRRATHRRGHDRRPERATDPERAHRGGPGVRPGRLGVRNVVVYDLGGGTFDVTVLTIAGGDFRVLATHGDRNLGGFDFDNELMRLLNTRFLAAGGPDLLDDPAWESALREKAELAKRTLSSAPSTQVVLSAEAFSTTLPVTRPEFEDLCSALVSRTRDSVEQVVEEAGLTWRQVDRVLLAGGSTRMPMIRHMLEKTAGHPPDWSQNPDELISQGAAIQAHLLEQEDSSTGADHRTAAPLPKVRDVTSHGLGQLLVYGSNEIERNTVIIPRNTPIPADGISDSETLRDYQENLTVQISQGDSRDPAHVRIIADRRFPITPRPRDSPMRLTLRYDIDQVIYAVVTDLTSGVDIGTFEIRADDAMEIRVRSELSDKIRRIDV